MWWLNNTYAADGDGDANMHKSELYIKKHSSNEQ